MGVREWLEARYYTMHFYPTSFAIAGTTRFQRRALSSCTTLGFSLIGIRLRGLTPLISLSSLSHLDLFSQKTSLGSHFTGKRRRRFKTNSFKYLSSITNVIWLLFQLLRLWLLGSDLVWQNFAYARDGFFHSSEGILPEYLRRKGKKGK
jgi:hypothetical protein